MKEEAGEFSFPPLHRPASSATLDPSRLLSTAAPSTPAYFTSFKPAIIADQFTRIDSELFSKVKPMQIVQFIISKQPAPSHSPIQVWVDWFNLVSCWVGTELCTEPELKKRVEILEHMIKLIKVISLLSFFSSRLFPSFGAIYSFKLQLTFAFNEIYLFKLQSSLAFIASNFLNKTATIFHDKLQLFATKFHCHLCLKFASVPHLLKNSSPPTLAFTRAQQLQLRHGHTLGIELFGRTEIEKDLECIFTARAWLFTF